MPVFFAQQQDTPEDIPALFANIVARRKMVKAKELKIMRKQMEKADRIPCSELLGKSTELYEARIPSSSPSDSANDDGSTNDEGIVQKGDNSNERNMDETSTTKSFAITCCSSTDMADDTMQECLQIFDANMGDLYRQSTWGLDLSTKLEELQHRKARFLMIHEIMKDDEKMTNNNNDSATKNDTTKSLAGFVHFRFCFNDDETPTELVLYVYEVQVRAEYQKSYGIGTKLMHTIETTILARSGMNKVMLTVFKANVQAMHFYRNKLKYIIDEDSPSKHDTYAEYEILSKLMQA